MTDVTGERLRPVFGGEDPLFVSDSLELVEWFRSLSLEALPLHEAEQLSRESVVLALTDFSQMGKRGELNAILGGSRVLFVPLASFDPRLVAASYTMTLLMRSDFQAAVDTNVLWVERLSSWDEPFRFVGDGTDMTCVLGDPISASTRTAVELEAREWDSPGAYFELNVIADPDRLRQAYDVHGVMSIDGLAAARHAGMPSAIVGSHERACALVRELVPKLPLELHIESSRVTACIAGGRDVAPQLREITNERYDLYLLEFAIGSNSSIAPFVDWRVNSQLNEGLGGVHVGLGDGLTGAHIDFICSGAEWTTGEV